MMNESTKVKTVTTVRAICGDLEKVAKKTLIFNASIQAMQQSDSFTKIDYELLFMEMASVINNTSKRIDEVLKSYQEEED